jgi:very-short-patch-repair endonuclease
LLLPAHTALLDTLDRHARRREEGIATLSALVGPPTQALALFTAWAHRRGVSVVVPDAEEPRELVRAWAAALARERELLLDAEAFVVLHAPQGAPRPLLFRGKTAHERGLLLDTLSPPHTQKATWELCCQLLTSRRLPAAGALPAEVETAIALEPFSALRALLGLVPARSTPILRLQAGLSEFGRLRAAAALAAAAPSLTLVCVLTPEAFEACQHRGESRVLAMLREGLLEIPAQGPSGAGPAAVAPTLARFQQEGTPEPLVAHYVEAARALTALDPESEGRSRSQAERFLYELLQHRPGTRDRFVLNGRVASGTGGRPLEVDLLCRELRLAVEIDGYFHFRGAEDFRRDRRKDVALQRLGYWVVRFLAEDVVARLEDILETLDTLIDARRQALAGQETPHGYR